MSGPGTSGLWAWKPRARPGARLFVIGARFFVAGAQVFCDWGKVCRDWNAKCLGIKLIILNWGQVFRDWGQIAIKYYFHKMHFENA